MQKKRNYSPKEFLIERAVFNRRRKVRKRRKAGYHYSQNTNKYRHEIKIPIAAPVDFRFIQNPIHALPFFNAIRNPYNCSYYMGKRTFRISFSKTKYIDFATLSILKCIFEESKLRGFSFKGNLPKDDACKKYLLKSGFLNNMFDDKLQEFKIKGNGKYFSIEKKEGIVTEEDLENFENISLQAFQHLHNKNGYFDEVITILKEIGGNAVEWSKSYKEQWQIGVYFKANKVIITATDLGRGIRDSLYISNKLKAIDFLLARNDLDILERAFDRKYGSLSQEVNRNQGLPSIKRAYSENKIAKLIVCTNNVFLHFSSTKESILLNNDRVNFFGTFYQWELNKTCLYNG